jgi:hypothetical protein
MMGSICSTTTTTDASTTKPFVRSWESYTREQAEGRPEVMEKSSEQKFTSIASLEQLPESSEDVIRDLEERQIPVIKDALQSANPADTLLSFMKGGTEEFKQRTGRTMTYAEMRATWG